MGPLEIVAAIVLLAVLCLAFIAFDGVIHMLDSNPKIRRIYASVVVICDAVAFVGLFILAICS